jgi:predicted O-methyltransferase YrrM
VAITELLKPLLPEFFRRPYRACAEIYSLRMSENFQFLRFAPPGHFYSPIPDIKELRSNSELIFDRSVRDIPGIDINEDRQLSLAKEFVALYGEIPFPDQQRDGIRYYFDNDHYGYGDAVCLYSLMRLIKPKRIVEVGSGFSSVAMLDVSDTFFGGEIEFTFIEPFPNRLSGLLRNEDLKRCRLLEQPVQQVPMGIFHRLQENDILFIDSSHVAKTHSDVLHILFTVLPSLSAGVLIHFHDILWPFEYPRDWLERGRAWNEAYFVRAFLQYNKAFEILYFSSFMETNHRSFLNDTMPLMLKAPSIEAMQTNSSLWVRKTL